MIRIGLSIGLAIAMFAPLAAAAAEDQHVAVQPGAVKWGPAPPALPKGAQLAVLYGDPGKDGPFVLRLKFPAGYKVPPHMHPSDENVTVISGLIQLSMGDKIEQKQKEALAAGGYTHMPKGMHHYGWAIQPTVVQVNGTGPFAITYVNPADDPRKTN
jgi:quercetin dioxygenase-like cupin family protein